MFIILDQNFCHKRSTGNDKVSSSLLIAGEPICLRHITNLGLDIMYQLNGKGTVCSYRETDFNRKFL